ncbi:MAG: outer membrane lipoprotein-sorting protein [Verrucomicrobia bacterium]|nr:outer membrane lipoprotein-sorting protein [Verrucomicrobiota bacterium]
MKADCRLQVAGCRLRKLRSSFLILCLLTLLCNARADSSAEALLLKARLRPTTHPITLNAEIRGGEEPLPLIFKIEKGQIEYLLQDPEEKIILTLGKTQTSLTDTQQEKNSSLSNDQRYQEIRHTGVTYDDLSLGFLYWPHPRLAGSEQLRGTKSSVLELFPPLDNQGPYGSARLWIDENSGAPLRMEGFDKKGNLLKRFEVISAQKIDGLWTLKEMRIETFDLQTHLVTQRRYLTVLSSGKNH